MQIFISDNMYKKLTEIQKKQKMNRLFTEIFRKLLEKQQIERRNLFFVYFLSQGILTTYLKRCRMNSQTFVFLIPFFMSIHFISENMKG